MPAKTAALIRHERIPADGVRLHVVGAGEGHPVVLLHGFPENWRSWRHQIGPLAEAGYAVRAPDLRGYNESDIPRERSAYALRHLVDDVTAIVRTAGSGPAHVVGHDWGGVIAWIVAAEYPELVDRLVILNAPHPDLYFRALRRPAQLWRSSYVLVFQMRPVAEWLLSAADFFLIRQMFTRAAGRPGVYAKAEIDAYVAGLSRDGALTAALNYYRANFRWATRRLGHLAAIRAPTLVIWGEQDPALGVELLDGLDQVVPGLEVHRISTAGHWVQNEAPGEVNRILLSFLKRSFPSDERL